MKVKKEEIIKVLENLRPGLARRESVDNLSDFFFCGKKITAFNGQFIVSGDFETDFECSINGENLYAVISRIPDEELNLKIKDSKLVIESKTSKASLITSEEETSKKIPIFPEKRKWKEVPKTFIEGIKLCSFNVSDNLTKPELACLFIKDKYIYSADNFRISSFLMSDAFAEDFLIPGTAASVLCKYSVKEYDIDKEWIHFKIKDKHNTIFSCRRVVGNYPDVGKFFLLKGTTLALPKTLKGAVESVSIILDDTFSIDQIVSVDVSKKDGTMTFFGKGSKGTFERKHPIGKGITQDASFDINPIFFLEILNSDVEMILSEGRALFKKASFKHVVCLSKKQEE